MQHFKPFQSKYFMTSYFIIICFFLFGIFWNVFFIKYFICSSNSYGEFAQLFTIHIKTNGVSYPIASYLMSRATMEAYKSVF